MRPGPFEVLLAATGQKVQRAAKSGGDWVVGSHLSGWDVRCLAASPAGVVLAGTQGRGLLRSDDGGESWSPSGLDGCIVKSLSFCTADDFVVYAGTKPPHLFRSSDAGRSWKELESFKGIRGRALWRQPAEKPSTAYVQSLACSPIDPEVVVAGMEAGAVVRTVDGGRTWSNHLQGSCRDCHSLHFHPDGVHVFEGGGGVMAAGVAISSDRGETWDRPAEGLDMKYGWAVAADPAEPQTTYVSLSPGARNAHSDGNAEAGIFRRDGGGPWRRLGGGLPEPIPHMPYALVTHPARPGYLLAGLADGALWETEDHGGSWASSALRFDAVHRVLVGL